MSVPNSEIRIGLAYREVVLLVLSKNPIKMKTELLKFYNEFNNLSKTLLALKLFKSVTCIALKFSLSILTL